MNTEFNVKTRVRRATNKYIDNARSCGWMDAYKDIQGHEAYNDGMVIGYNNGYVDGCWELKSHLKFILKNEPDTTLKDIILKYIVEE